MNRAANGNASKVMAACRHFLGRVTVAGLAKVAGLSLDQTGDALQILVAHGLVDRRLRGVFRLTPAGFEALVNPPDLKSGPKGPRPLTFPESTARERLWRAIRQERKASLQELRVLASRGEEVGLDDAKKYLNALVKSGHLLRLEPRSKEKATGLARYLLVRDTGPLPPQYNKRQGRVYDPNNGRTHELA